MLIVLVAGARPNFMKVGPVLAALEERDDVGLCWSTPASTTTTAMSDVFFDELGHPASPIVHLGAGRGSHAEQTASVMTAFESLLEECRPDIVVVPGDVNSTLACALVAAKAGALVAHVEAGLRSRRLVHARGDQPGRHRPGERLPVRALRRRGGQPPRPRATGRTRSISSATSWWTRCSRNLERARRRPTLADLGLEPGGYGAVTLHRPANVDDPERSPGRCSRALAKVAERIPLVFPAHPRAADRMRAGQSERPAPDHRAPRLPGLPRPAGRCRGSC